MTHDELETIELRFAYRYVNTNNYKVFIDTAEIDIGDLIAEVKRLTRERDAAVADMVELSDLRVPCTLCKNGNDCDITLTDLDYFTGCFKWRGVQEADNEGN